ncbi:MAG: surface lipoprotein assembly modifier [Casimicrobiaceae bacterium]
MPTDDPSGHRAGRRRATAVGAASAWIACVAAAPALATPLDDLRAAVEAGDSAAAYAAHCATPAAASERAPQFDLWCGVAAVDIGRAGEGVLTLERYVLQFPDDARARLELARAYFYAGDDVRSREEFEAVAKSKPPPDVQAGIDRYLAALAVREARYRGRRLAFVEVGGGYDSNANAGVAQAEIGLPVLGQVTVADFGVRKGSGFGWLAAGGEIHHPLAPGWNVDGSVYGGGTFYATASEFDLSNYGASVGASYRAARNDYALSYAHGEITLDGSRYRWTDGIGFEWRRQVSELSSFALAPQYVRIGYAGDNAARNADLTALVASYRRVWLRRWQPILNTTIFYGDERSREDRGDLGRGIRGAGLDVTVSPSPFWALNAGVSFAQSDYDAPTPLLDVTRRDRNLGAGLSAVYLINAHLSLRAEYRYARNASNIELYDYTRHLGALKVRYEFK